MERDAAHSYLIVLTGSLGDVVRGLPLVWAIAEAEPRAGITWLIEDTWREIAALHPRIDRIIEFRRKEGARGVAALWRELRRERYDVVLDLQRHLKSAIFNRMARAGRRIGFHPRDAKEGNWLFNTEHIERAGMSISKSAHYLLFLDRAGVPRPTVLRSGLEQVDAQALAPNFFTRVTGEYVVVVLGSSWPSKDWPAQGYDRLIGLLLERDSRTVVLAGARAEAPLARELAERHGPRVAATAGETSLRELVGILRGASAAVGPDSGPGHICAALKTPYVSLFGPTDPVRVAPQGCEDLVIRSAVGCSPCWRRECPGLNRICMRLIEPETVYQTVQRAAKIG